MGAFKYKLDKYLKVKGIGESRAVERLKACIEERDCCLQEILSLNAEYKAAMERLVAGAGAISPLEYQLVARRLVLLGARLETLLIRRAELDSLVAGRRAEAQQLVLERQAHERLKDRARDDWRRSERRRELKAMDAAGSVLVNRREKEDVDG